jgi:hypothetical protein
LWERGGVVVRNSYKFLLGIILGAAATNAYAGGGAMEMPEDTDTTFYQGGVDFDETKYEERKKFNYKYKEKSGGITQCNMDKKTGKCATGTGAENGRAVKKSVKKRDDFGKQFTYDSDTDTYIYNPNYKEEPESVWKNAKVGKVERKPKFAGDAQPNAVVALPPDMKVNVEIVMESDDEDVVATTAPVDENAAPKMVGFDDALNGIMEGHPAPTYPNPFTTVQNNYLFENTVQVVGDVANDLTGNDAQVNNAQVSIEKYGVNDNVSETSESMGMYFIGNNVIDADMQALIDANPEFAPVNCGVPEDADCPFENEDECKIWKAKPHIKTTQIPNDYSLSKTQVCSIIGGVIRNQRIPVNSDVGSALIAAHQRLLSGARDCCMQVAVAGLSNNGAPMDVLAAFKSDVNNQQFAQRCLLWSPDEINGIANGDEGLIAIFNNARNTCVANAEVRRLIAPFMQIYNTAPGLRNMPLDYKIHDVNGAENQVSITFDIEGLRGSLGLK